VDTISAQTTAREAPRAGWWQRFRRAGGLRRSDWLWGYLFISLNLIGFLIFSLGPIIQSLVMSFMSWSLLQPPKFVGLDNFRRLLDDELFRQVMGNTTYFVVFYVPLITVLAFLLAVVLNRPLRGVTLFRAAYFLPSVTMMVSVAMVWGWLIDPQAGIINYMIERVGLRPPMWLADVRTAMPTIIIISVWQDVGYFAVIYLAGLQAIPSTLYEAAEIDGANGWQQMTQITVPLITPTTFFVLVTSMITGWQVFSLAFLMTHGGPAYSTTTLLYYVYQQGFTNLRLGYASLMSWVLFLVIFIVTIIQWRVVKGGEYVGA
jgi:multiple sugar transport system permease protein